VSTLSTQLSWSHYTELLSIKDEIKLYYYLTICINQHIDVRTLRQKIKSNEYERLDEKTKYKLITKENNEIEDFIKNPIIIHTKNNNQEISEKLLKKLILEDLDNFLKELGQDFVYVGNEYKIKLGERYNYIDILLYNLEFKCFVVVELKVTELRSEYIGQIEKYMNYINKNVKRITDNETIGIIICKKENKFILEYCSNNKIFETTYKLND
jgi:predicted nuclease of restriction endonuclease-like (RecB) superfamily